MSVGDCLKEAEQFSRLCDVRLEDIMTLSANHHSRDKVNRILGSIQYEAGRVKARAIGRAAKNAIEDLRTEPAKDPLGPSFLALHNLIRQYQSGLVELISPETEQTQARQAQLSSVITEDDIKANETARRTLLPLLKYADRDSDIASLRRIASYRTHSNDPLNFETIMPSLTEDILRTARSSDKYVSISHSVDDILMDTDVFTAVSHAVHDLAAGLVELAIETPDTRLGKGLGQSAHIAVTARKQAGSFNVLIVSEGSSPGDILKATSRIDPIKQHGGDVRISQKGAHVRIELIDLPCEGTLPQRLGALMTNADETLLSEQTL